MARCSALARRRRHAVLALAAALTAGIIGPLPSAAANPPCAGCGPAKWHVVESANFRIFSYGTSPPSRQTAETCENLRAELARLWLDGSTSAWRPKCDVVLHASDSGYLREVGTAGRNTIASALVDRRTGCVSLRRIDVRATRADWPTAALAHELVHVVLADRFAGEPLPRWLDEGMAILADPPQKQRQHERDLRRAIARGTQFRVAELWSIADYPAAERWATFYGQSASLVAYLVEQQGHGRFAEFVDLARARGYEQALRHVYGFDLGELERRWHAQLVAPAAPPAVAAEARASESPGSMSAG